MDRPSLRSGLVDMLPSVASRRLLAVASGAARGQLPASASVDRAEQALKVALAEQHNHTRERRVDEAVKLKNEDADGCDAMRCDEDDGWMNARARARRRVSGPVRLLSQAGIGSIGRRGGPHTARRHLH